MILKILQKLIYLDSIENLINQSKFKKINPDEDANWLNIGNKLFKKFSAEEMLHAEKAKDMLLANGLQPITPALAKPQQEFKNLPNVIALSFEHEKEITRQCYDLTKAAFKEDNYMVAELGLWYAKEQAEELDKFQNLVDRLEAFGTDPDLLRELDDEMAQM